MIGYLNGNVLLIRKESLILNVGGIGFEVYVLRPERYACGQEQSFFTYLQSREEGPVLFGFEENVEYELFCQLIRIRGIGPKTALNMLSGMRPRDLLQAIEDGDLKALKSLPGIGAKTASQMILDLKGRIVVEEKENGGRSQDPAASGNPVWDETAEALESLGYRPQQIAFLKEEMVPKTDLDVDAMLKECLKKLALAGGF